MIISFGAVVSILRLGGFLQHTSANVLEDVTDEKDYKSAVALKKYMKEIRSVNPGAQFYSLEKSYRKLV